MYQDMQVKRKSEEMPLKRLLKTSEVAEVLNVSMGTVYRYIESGELKGVRVGGRWRVPQSCLEEYLSNLQ